MYLRDSNVSASLDALMADYQVDADGVVRAPGKFENEYVYVVLAYESYLDGFADERANGTLVTAFPSVLCDRFPKWRKRKQVKLLISDSGFVYGL